MSRLLNKPPHPEAMHATDHEAMQACRPAGLQAQKHYTAAQNMQVPEGSRLKRASLFDAVMSAAGLR